MYSMHEALARDRMRERELQARRAHEVSAVRRYRSAAQSRASERRHARRSA
jgi:hypothetical protein